MESHATKFRAGRTHSVVIGVERALLKTLDAHLCMCIPCPLAPAACQPWQ